MSARPHVVFFGHHKCASRFLRLSVLTPLAEQNGYDVVGYAISEERRPFHFDKCHELDLYNIPFQSFATRPPTLLKLSNAGTPVVERVKACLPDFRGIHMIRDPRQIVASGYFHHLDGHAVESPHGWVWDRLKADRALFQSLSLEDGLIHEMNSVSADVIENQLAPWEPDDRVLEFKVETFNDDLEANVEAICEHLGFHQLGEIASKRQFANASSRHWSECFTDKVVDAFKARFGQTLIDLGYETDFEW